MIQIKMLDNGPFSTMLEKRIKEWSAVKELGVIIHTPPELNWWYYNEFGTATKREGQGVPTGAYEIPSSGVSIFTYQGVKHFRKAGVNPVVHPGTKAIHAVSLSQPQYQDAIKKAVRRGFAFGSLDSSKKLLASMHKGMEKAKEFIAEKYDYLQDNDYHTAPGGIEGTGKLQGRKAAADYRELARVLDIKE